MSMYGDADGAGMFEDMRTAVDGQSSATVLFLEVTPTMVFAVTPQAVMTRSADQLARLQDCRRHAALQGHVGADHKGAH